MFSDAEEYLVYCQIHWNLALTCLAIAISRLELSVCGSVFHNDNAEVTLCQGKFVGLNDLAKLICGRKGHKPAKHFEIQQDIFRAVR
jgi:hypothetical protein